MIAIVDFKAGNLASVKKAFDYLGQESVITSQPAAIADAAKIVLPGVGHFAATRVLETSDISSALKAAIERGVPFLGICVGMQWLFEGSTEAPEVPGLSLFAGTCRRFEGPIKVPHVGWNQLRIENSSRLFQGIKPSEFVYFTHSYRAPLCDATSAACDYGGSFSAGVERDNVFGVQFHPEKSGPGGLQMLRNFCELPC